MPDAHEDFSDRLAAPAFTRDRAVRVVSTKYDGSPHYEYRAYLIDVTGPVVRCWVPASTPWSGYRGEGLLREAFTAIFFSDRWYNLFHNHHPMGRREIETYSNIALPAQFDGEAITWVDLDIDVIRARSGVIVDDEDEFAEHRVRMSYPDELAERVLSTTTEVTRMVYEARFPFDRGSHIP